MNGLDDPILEQLARQVAKKLGPSRNPVCYTVNLGDYDEVRRPRTAQTGVDLVCFSSGRKAPRPWKTIRLQVPDRLGATRLNRLLKLFPHLLFPQAEHSLYCDANLEILRPLAPLFSEPGFLTVSRHPLRNCIYDEAVECKARRKDSPEIIDAQMARYCSEGFPAQWGLAENRVLVRRHGSDALDPLMRAWWSEISQGSRRDQLSLLYCVWRSGGSIVLSDYGTLVLPQKLLHQTPDSPPFFILHRHGRTLRGLAKLAWRLRRKLSQTIFHRAPRETLPS